VTRPSLDETFMAMADLVAERGTCPRAKVGAMLVRQKDPLCFGYNGAPPGFPHCDVVGCSGEDRCENTIHAEVNAIGRAARLGIRTEGAHLYCTHFPCVACCHALIAAGIDRLTYREPYRYADAGRPILWDSSVRVFRHVERRP